MEKFAFIKDSNMHMNTDMKTKAGRKTRSGNFLSGNAHGTNVPLQTIRRVSYSNALFVRASLETKCRLNLV